MSIIRSLTASLALMGTAAALQYLAPVQDINLPSTESAKEPLQWLGANGPYHAGPNVHGISAEVPEGCTVEQAAYVLRHGSRYPDKGAFGEWVEMEQKLRAANFTAKGSLSFLPDWHTVLTNPDLQIAMLSPTGSKEAFDLGYTLRTRYPQLYDDGDDFLVWANNYTRVLQTAQTFVRGFLGWKAAANGSVISVTSKGFPEALGNSLGPSDMCPNFEDTSGANQTAEWTDVFVPRIRARLQALIEGNLTLSSDDITRIPYLCGFESQITGTLSPWCGVFTDEELRDYAYLNDLRYYYGVGPGSGLPATLMTPFLDSLAGLLQKGPDITGKAADGSAFRVPRLIMAFLNDGQLNELVAASGVFDEQLPLSSTRRDDGRQYVVSRYGTMRGTIAFEKLRCEAGAGGYGYGYGHGHGSGGGYGSPYKSHGAQNAAGNAAGSAAYIRIRLNDAVYPVPACRNGPGSSCPLDDYVEYVQRKYAGQGDWLENCNVTMEGAPSKVQGASFFTDLSSPFLQRIDPRG